jgi:hypothetical protein
MGGECTSPLERGAFVSRDQLFETFSRLFVENPKLIIVTWLNRALYFLLVICFKSSSAQPYIPATPTILKTDIVNVTLTGFGPDDIGTADSSLCICICWQ